MTANQIEYWKLQETKRHNVVTEEMEKPVKYSQALLNYENVKTAPTVRALNIAQEAAARANEAYAYAGANERYAAAALDYAMVETEATKQAVNRAQESLNLSKAANVDVSTEAMRNEMPASQLTGAQADLMLGNFWSSKRKDNMQDMMYWNSMFGGNAISTVSGAAYNAARTYSLFQ